MGRHAQRDRWQIGGHQMRQARSGAQWQNKCQRPWPEPLRQITGGRGENRNLFGLRHPRDMHDQGVKSWAAFGIEYPRNGHIITRIAAKAIDRFRGKGDKPARAQRGSSGSKAAVIGGKGGGLGHM